MGTTVIRLSDRGIGTGLLERGLQNGHLRCDEGGIDPGQHRTGTHPIADLGEHTRDATTLAFGAERRLLTRGDGPGEGDGIVEVRRTHGEHGHQGQRRALTGGSRVELQPGQAEADQQGEDPESPKDVSGDAREEIGGHGIPERAVGKRDEGGRSMLAGGRLNTCPSESNRTASEA